MSNSIPVELNGARSSSKQGKVYVGTAWFRDADPFFSVIISATKHSEKSANRLFDRLLEEEVKDLYEGADWGDLTYEEFADDVRWPGSLYLEDIKDVLQGVPVKQRAEILDDLHTQGYAHLPVG